MALANPFLSPGSGTLPGAGSGDLMALLSNPLMHSMGLNVGNQMVQGLPATGGLDALLQPVIGAKSKDALQQAQMAMLAKMLKGAMDPGTSSKLTMDGTKLKYEDDMSMESGLSLANQGAQLPGGSGKTWEASPFLNPSASPASGYAAYAGLTPEDVTQALAGAINIESLKGKRFSEISDALYKSQLGDYYKSVAAAQDKGTALDQAFPVEVPGVGQVTQRQWNALPSGDREYALFVATSKKLGDVDIMSKAEFDQLEPTDREKFLRAAMEDPNLMDAAKSLATAGATRIGDFRERAEVGAEVKRQSIVKSPNFVQDVKENLMKDKRSWRSTDQVEELSKSQNITFEQARDRIQKTKVLKEMDSQIRSAYPGQTVERRIDGWYVNGELVRRNPYGG